MKNKIVIGLPAYNEEASLPKILNKLLLLLDIFQQRLNILVINDGSIDDTEKILMQYNIKYHCIHYINHDRNMGLGIAMSTLLDYVAENYTQDDILVTLDSDNTHNPKIISAMVNQLTANNLDIVIASRFVKGGKEIGLSLIRKLFSRGAMLFFKIFFPIKNVRDYSCGFRVYKIKALQNALNIYHGNLITTNGFDCMAEILARFSKIHVRASEYPLVLEYNLKEGKSKMKIGKTILGYFNLLKRVKYPIN
jgi:dolichol-phosphate mannosyltransferase